MPPLQKTKGIRGWRRRPGIPNHPGSASGKPWAGRCALLGRAGGRGTQPWLQPPPSPPCALPGAHPDSGRPRWERRVPALAGPPPPPAGLRGAAEQSWPRRAWPAPCSPRILRPLWLTAATRSSPHLLALGLPPSHPQQPSLPVSLGKGGGAGRRDGWPGREERSGSEHQSWGCSVGGGGAWRRSPSKVGNQVPGPRAQVGLQRLCCGQGPVRGVRALGAVPSWTLSGS